MGGDVPPPGALISLGFQHVLTMFPATALVAIITGFDIAVTVFASGLATTVAALGSRNRIPLYYGKLRLSRLGRRRRQRGMGRHGSRTGRRRCDRHR
jgi:Permease family